jgi:hypothetical protein
VEKEYCWAVTQSAEWDRVATDQVPSCWYLNYQLNCLVYIRILLIKCIPSSHLCKSGLALDLTEHSYCVSQEVSILVQLHPTLMRPALTPPNLAFAPLLILLWLYVGCPWYTQAPPTFQVPHSCPFFIAEAITYDLSKFEALNNILWHIHFFTLRNCWPLAHPASLWQHLVSCLWLFSQSLRSCFPYQQSDFSVWNLRTCHANVVGSHLAMDCS